MSTYNIGFYEEISKIITLLSSNTHLISTAGGSPSPQASNEYQTPVFFLEICKVIGELLQKHT